MESLRKSFAKAVSGKPNKGDEIIATFKDGSEITYTKAILSLLATDSDVVSVISKETGELIFIR